jgi:hypothetical protein
MALGLAAGAIPAFTADSGTLTVGVTAEAPATPCVTVTPDTIDFGTLPFSTPTARITREAATMARVTNCGAASQNVMAAGTDAASSSGGSWNLGLWSDAPPEGNPCVVGPNLYFLNTNTTAGAVVVTRSTITKTSAFLLAPGLAPAVWPASASTDIGLELTMPCRGSNGGGEAKTLSITFTAVVT